MVTIIATSRDLGEQILHLDAYLRTQVERGVRGTFHPGRSLYGLKENFSESFKKWINIKIIDRNKLLFIKLSLRFRNFVSLLMVR